MGKPMPKPESIKKLKIEGFLSIRDATIAFEKLNVLIGANGSGKSNLLNLFRLLKHLTQGELKEYVQRLGGADKLLHYGRKRTNSLKVDVTFNRKPSSHTEYGNFYSFFMLADNDDNLFFARETLGFHDKKNYDIPYEVSTGGGGFESALSKHHIDSLRESVPMARYVIDCLNAYRIYHFHDTSEGAKVKQASYIHDNGSFHSDGGNLAAFLYRLREKYPAHYRQIVDAIRLTNPYFGDFVLEPNRLNPDLIRLEWRERLSETMFSPHALSDGTLRFICLATLFLQPPDLMPAVALLDEPELGLHPFAIQLLADMMKSASNSMQIIAATQSPILLSWFEPKNILVTERIEGASQFKRLNFKDIKPWLDEYSLGEIWEKNLIGGRPK